MMSREVARPRRIVAIAIVGAITAAATPSGVAGQATTSTDPCAYQPIDLERYGSGEFANPPHHRSTEGVLDVELRVRYATHEIAGCQVRHRSYNGLLVGPTLRVQPGTVINVDLRNELPPDPDMIPRDPNVPHDFNTTNLHTHGLHVSPVGNSDNVLLAIPGGASFSYEIRVPADHPPGTFWYHAHLHGSTAIQVSSGMGGALIIEGGLDDVREIEDAADQVLMFQQISYDTAGVIEDFSMFGPGTWEAHKRQVTINGQIAPVIHMRPGEVQRWRLIHGGIRETIMAQLEGHTLHEVAVDGIALGRCNAWPSVELQPGYRSDVLVQAGAPGEYWLVDARTPPGISLRATEEQEKRLLRVVVDDVPPERTRLPCDPGELSDLAPLDSIRDDEIKGRQHVVFSVDSVEEGFEFTVNGRSFSRNHVRELKLGTADEWIVETDNESQAPNHPFHIHVNPFQYTRAGPDGRPETVWRDTLIIRRGQPETLRSRYERYIGTFVMHCHILDHEDQGMMEVMQIVP